MAEAKAPPVGVTVNVLGDPVVPVVGPVRVNAVAGEGAGPAVYTTGLGLVIPAELEILTV